jgi:hypothetical protein
MKEEYTKKIIYLPEPKNNSKKEEEKREKRKRIITQTNKWNDYFQNKETDFNKEIQLELLSSLQNSTLEEDKKIHFLREQIRQKIHNYYAQDMKKQLYNPDNFITLEYILQKLKDCNLDCFYCNYICHL